MKKVFKFFTLVAIALCVALTATAGDAGRAMGTGALAKRDAKPVAHFKHHRFATVKGSQANAPVKAKTTISSKAAAPFKAQVMPKADVALPNIVASVVDGQALNVGMYQITADGLVALKKDYRMSARNGGAAIGDQYIACYMDQFEGVVYGAYYRIIDMSTWTIVNENYEAPYNMMAECMTSDGTTIYGCFYNNDLSGYELGTMSIDPAQRTGTIRQLGGYYSALACDDNYLYGIYPDGSLMQISKTDGSEMLLSSTGLQSSYLTSAVYDTRKHILYYSTCNDSEIALYSIDFNNSYAVAKVCDLAGEVCGMHIVLPPAEDDAPAAVNDLQVQFEGGSLVGSATFTMPTATFAGGTLTGNCEYKVMVNKQVVVQGNAAAGESVLAPVAVDAPGSYKFSVVASNSVGQSPASNAVSMWVGPDAPVAPFMVEANYSNGRVTVSWDACNMSQHGGYFDADQVKYRVIRYKNNIEDGLVASYISTTSCIDPITTEPEALTILTYKVIAFFETSEAEPTSSNPVVFGSIIPPYTNNFENADFFAPFTVIDANDDFNSWGWTPGWDNEGAAFVGYSWENDMDDWLMTPAIKLEAGKAYRLTIAARNEGQWYKDLFEVKMGTASTVEAMTIPVIGVTELSGDTYGNYYAVITPEATGTYYLGIHCLSAKNQGGVYIDAITIDAPLSDQAPAAVDNVKFVGQPDGSMAIDVSFNAPTKNIAGNDLTSLTQVKLTRDGEVVKTFAAPAPGAALTFKDYMDGEERNVHYTIVASNDAGEGMVYESDAYAGLKVPATPTGCKVVESKTTLGQCTITWDPVTTSVDGDPMNQNLITYSIYDINEQPLATGLTAADAANGYTTQVQLPDDGEQALTIYYIFAHNRKGNSVNGFTQMIPVGPAYSVPFKESAPDAIFTHPVWMQEGAASWGTTMSCFVPLCTPVDGDNGMIYMEPFLAKQDNMLLSAKVHIPEADNLCLSFYYCGTDEDRFDFVPVVRIPSGDTYYIGEYIHTNSAGQGWHQVIVPMDQFKGQDVQVGLNVNGRSMEDYFLIDCVEVREFAAHDIAAGDITVPSTITAGKANKISVKIANAGTNAVEQCEVALFAGEEKVASTQVTNLAVSESRTIDFNICPAPTALGSVSYYGKVIFAADENPDNNVTEAKTTEVVASTLPTVTIEGLTTGSTVTLTWEDPSTEASTQVVNDDLENYESFVVNRAGNYTFYDLDGSSTFALENGAQFPHNGEPMAFITFDIAQLSEADQAKCSGYAHSGNKCLASIASTTSNNDWLISPELPGNAQTISFWNRSANVSYGFDEFQVLYSTTGNTPADFTQLGENYASNLGWSKIEVELPEGTKYFAIRCISFMTVGWLLDDITYTAGTPAYTALGYNIYRNGEKINSDLVTECAYTDNIAAHAIYDYNVTAVYAEGESALSNTYSTAPTGIDDINTGVAITATKGAIIVSGAHNTAVYGIDGKLHAQAVGNAVIPVEAGLYIVKADAKVAKVLVK